MLRERRRGGRRSGPGRGKRPVPPPPPRYRSTPTFPQGCEGGRGCSLRVLPTGGARAPAEEEGGWGGHERAAAGGPPPPCLCARRRLVTRAVPAGRGKYRRSSGSRSGGRGRGLHSRDVAWRRNRHLVLLGLRSRCGREGLSVRERR